ncbi:immune inhibitor A domain-containing protein [Halobacterium wangiae]|uniref:immune inhibitor A domain-containing protein n=1 Tax=Halobacterium wangiae TaxID=2902623 RepID=UPI001E485F27|nr:immune inhibitor A domain-containing protein [Halobacterium wangiae]
MTAVLVVASLAAGVGTAAAAPAPDANQGTAPAVAPEPTAENNSTDGYRAVEPSQNWTDKPVLETEISADGESASDSGSGGAQSTDGMTRQFLTSGPEGYTLTTFELREVGDNVEVWVATDLSWGVPGDRETPSISDRQAEHIAEEFDENIYPTESEVFGTPDARDGEDALLGPSGYYNTTADAGNKTVLLVQNIRDENFYNPDYPLYIAGYYSPTVQQYSDRNVINVDAYGWSNVTEESPNVGYEGTLAHEYQHLIHADLDSDETTWVNEGMSDYAEVVTGYGTPEGHLSAYESMPSNSLTNWEDQGAINVLADYGVAYAWTQYVADRYGQSFVSNLAKEEKNGIEGVEATLDEVGADTDFDGLYQDFSTAVVTDRLGNPLKDQFKFDSLDVGVNTSTDVGTAGVWGTNYRTIDTAETGPITDVTVSGTDFTETEWSTATDPVTGEGEVLYSGSGNLLNRHAIVETNLSGTENPTLSFDSFQRIESNWDYGFVQVSTDGGETWESLANEHTDDSAADGAHPRVQANLPGLTGDTDGWESQSFDLSAYEGNESVLVSFRYVTDWAVTQPGWWVKDVTVAGESVETDSVEPYQSLREATGDNVEYQFTFVGVKHNGNYQVKQLDTRTFDDSGEEELKQFLHNGNFERVVVASTWAGDSGESGRVPVGVEFEFASENGNDGDGNGQG